MENNHFTKWIPHENVDSIYDLETIGWRSEGFVLTLFPDHFDHNKRSECNLEMIWSKVLCYQVTEESYRPDWWKSTSDELWAFYISESSEFLKNFRKDNYLVPETVYHFVVLGTNFVMDILSEEYPAIRFVK